MRTDYVSGPDRRAILLAGSEDSSANCWHIYGCWSNGAAAVGTVHAHNEDEARKIVAESGLVDFEVMLSH